MGYLGISGTLITLVPNKKKTAMEIYICIYKKREREREKNKTALNTIDVIVRCVEAWLRVTEKEHTPATNTVHYSL